MELEGYLNFVNSNDIRIKGTRIGIEFVIQDYRLGASPEEIVLRYPSLALEQVHAVIIYYLHHRESTDAYVERWLAESRKEWREQESREDEFLRNLRQRLEKAHRESCSAGKLPGPRPAA
jgi:uncharacterized protein (DUF433 family)